MTSSDDAYIQVLPDYENDDVTSPSFAKVQLAAATDDKQVKSRDAQTTSEYEHPQTTVAMDCDQLEFSTYQRMIASRRLPSDDMQLMTSDMTYDEIADIPPPPPLRPGLILMHI